MEGYQQSNLKVLFNHVKSSENGGGNPFAIFFDPLAS